MADNRLGAFVASLVLAEITTSLFSVFEGFFWGFPAGWSTTFSFQHYYALGYHGLRKEG